MPFRKPEMIDLAADIVLQNTDTDDATAREVALEIYEQWDAVFSAFDTYEEYNNRQLDLFDDQGDLFDEREPL